MSNGAGIVSDTNGTGIGGLLTPPPRFEDICTMTVTNLCTAIGLTGFTCANISWSAPSNGTGHPTIALLLGAVTSSSSCAFSMDVHDVNAGASGRNIGTFRYTVGSTRRAAWLSRRARSP
jgi:hypothetical protein